MNGAIKGEKEVEKGTRNRVAQDRIPHYSASSKKAKNK